MNSNVDSTTPTSPAFTATAVPVLAKNGSTYDVTVLEIDDLYGISPPGTNSAGKILEVSSVSGADSHPESYVWKTYKKEGTSSTVMLTTKSSPIFWVSLTFFLQTLTPVKWYRVGDLVHVEFNIKQTGAWNNSNNQGSDLYIYWPTPL